MSDLELEATINKALEKYSDYLMDNDKDFQDKFKEDFRQGFKQGQKESSLEVAKKMLSMDMSPEIIMQVTGIDKSDLENLN